MNNSDDITAHALGSALDQMASLEQLRHAAENNPAISLVEPSAHTWRAELSAWHARQTPLPAGAGDHGPAQFVGLGARELEQTSKKTS